MQCSADADDDSFVYTTERQRQVPVALVGPRHCACRLCACARSDACLACAPRVRRLVLAPRVPSARRIGCGDRSIERTQRRWPSRHEQVRFALLCLAGRRAQSARRTPALAEPKGCYAKHAARVRRKPIDALSAAARSRSRSHCLISERILCSQRSIGFVGVGDGTMGRRRSDLRASHAKPIRCVAPRRVAHARVHFTTD